MVRDGAYIEGYRDLFKQHILKTCTYCAVFWSFGLSVSFLGPTLLDLECRISSEFSSMSWMFFSQSLFTLIGSACGGLLAQRFGNNRMLLISTIMISITMMVIPYCNSLSWLTVVLALMGFFMGNIDTVANISMIELYGQRVAPFLQSLHFFYGLGAFIAPLVAEPFLLNKDCSTKEISPSKSSGGSHFKSEVQYAFWILSSLQIPVIVLLTVIVIGDMREQENLKSFSCNDKIVEKRGGIELVVKNDRSSSQSEDQHITGNSQSEVSILTKEQFFSILGLTGAILFIYDGLQVGYGAYIFSYGIKSVSGMAVNEAAFLNACFWGSFAFGRLLSIGLSTKLPPSTMLLCNISGTTFAMMVMLAFRGFRKMLYIGTLIFGFFMSSVFPTAVSLAETSIECTDIFSVSAYWITNVTSILVVCAAFGEMSLPVIIGHIFDSLGPIYLLITGLILTLTSLCTYLALTLVIKQIGTRPPRTEVKLQNLFTGANEEEVEGLNSYNEHKYSTLNSQLSENQLQKNFD